MQHRTVRPAVRALATALLVASLGALAVLVLASGAHSHDALLESVPADGESLPAAPAEVVLTFSADVLPIAPAIVVRDGAGAVVVDAEPALDGPRVSAHLPAGLATGSYSVSWRVVSQDGHPIEGTFAFTVAGPATGDTVTPDPVTPDPATADPATADPGAAAVSPAPPTASSSATPEPVPGSGLAPLARLALALGATGAVAAAAVAVARRRRA